MRDYSTREYYNTRVYRLAAILSPLIAMCSGLIFSLLKAFGWFEVELVRLMIFDAVCVTYFCFGFYMSRSCFGSDGIVLPGRLRSAKICLTLTICFHWNLITYLVPFREFWAFAPLFLLISALFLDSRMVIRETVLLLVSIFVSWAVAGEKLLPPRDEFFRAAIVLRVTALVLPFAMICLMVILVERILLTELDNLSNFDSLTGLLTRRRLQKRFEELRKANAEHGVPFCAAFLDLDDFKGVNDTYGHSAGDEVLRVFSLVMQVAAGERGTVFRYGGEEFVILFRADAETARKDLERVLAELRERHYEFSSELTMTVTAGLAEYQAPMTCEDLIGKADQAMYSGKKAGKNRVVVAGGVGPRTEKGENANGTD